MIVKGKDRGKSGKVLRLLPAASKVVVEGMNLVKRATRAKRQGEKGQIVLKENPLRVENVKFVCPACGKPSKIAYRREGQNKVRFCKQCRATV